MTEAQLKRKVVYYLEKHSVTSYGLPASKYSKHGLHDRAMHLHGEVIYMEFKRDGGKQSNEQMLWQAQCELDGIQYWLLEGEMGWDIFQAQMELLL